MHTQKNVPAEPFQDVKVPFEDMANQVKLTRTLNDILYPSFNQICTHNFESGDDFTKALTRAMQYAQLKGWNEDVRALVHAFSKQLLAGFEVHHYKADLFEIPFSDDKFYRAAQNARNIRDFNALNVNEFFRHISEAFLLADVLEKQLLYVQFESFFDCQLGLLDV